MATIDPNLTVLAFAVVALALGFAFMLLIMAGAVWVFVRALIMLATTTAFMRQQARASEPSRDAPPRTANARTAPYMADVADDDLMDGIRGQRPERNRYVVPEVTMPDDENPRDEIYRGDDRDETDHDADEPVPNGGHGEYARAN